MRKNSKSVSDEFTAEEMSRAVMGKYRGVAAASNVVRIDPALSAAFPDSQTVNRGLHDLLMLRKLMAEHGLSTKNKRRRTA